MSEPILPKCPGCGHTKFRVKMTAIDPAPEQAHFIVCSKCGAIVGTHPADVMHHLEYLEKVLNIF
jgi:transcription elongation factor Elf1